MANSLEPSVDVTIVMSRLNEAAALGACIRGAAHALGRPPAGALDF
jgi:hypothetical protein